MRDGRSQRQRFLKELSPDYVDIDGRSTSDLLVFASEFAKQVLYYDNNNVNIDDDDNWTDFINNDISTRIALIAVNDPNDDYDVYIGHVGDLEALLALEAPAVGSPEETDRIAEIRAALEQVFVDIIAMYSEIDDWYLQVEDHDSFHEETGLLIRGKLRKALKKLIGYVKGGQAYGHLSASVSDGYANFQTDWIEGVTGITWGEYIGDIAWTPVNTEAYGLAAPGGPDIFDEVKEQTSKILDKLDLVFNAAWESELRLASQAEKFLLETLDDWPSHQPHYALFLSFLLLFRNSQDHLNTLTQSHLEFHYRDVLGMKENELVPDQVHLVFKLAKNLYTHKLEEGLEFTAGKDSLKKHIVYKLDDELILNTGLAADFKSIFVDDTDFRRLYAAPEANSGDGLGGEFENEDDPAWKQFGSDANPLADVGFAVASPALFLAEGTRNIKLTFTFDADSWAELEAQRNSDISYLSTNNPAAYAAWDVNEDFQVYITTQKAWYQLENVAVGYGASMYSLEVKFSLTTDDNPVTAYTEKAHGTGFDTTYPVVKLVMNPEQEIYPYSFLRLGKLEGIKVHVEAIGVKTILIQNENSPLDPAKKFQPFGSRPYPGNHFYIGSPEVFSKELKRLKVNMNWLNKPADLNAWYDSYADAITTITVPSDNTFKTNLSILTSSGWKKLHHYAVIGGSNQLNPVLFYDNVLNKTSATNTAPTAGETDSSFEITSDAWDYNNSLHGIKQADSLGDFSEFTPDLKRGFIRLTLNGSSFLHQDFANVYTLNAIALATKDNLPGGAAPVLPNEPYTPEVNAIELEYEAEATLDLRYKCNIGPEFEERVEKFWHIGPFGTEEVHPDLYVPHIDDEGEPEEGIYMVSQFEGKGNFFFGISGMILTESRSISVLFQVSEGSADPDTLHPDIVWYYRGQEILPGDADAGSPAKSYWKKLEATEVIGDTTNGLLNSGIIEFILPKDAASTHTLYPDALHWIMGVVNEEVTADGTKSIRGVSSLLDVRAQAMRATFSDNGNDPSHLAEALAADSVTKLLVKQAEVKTISQPYASFNGKLPESGESFYTRVSERLRHKDRAITIWDYEALVLQQFPSVYRVKCLNHTSSCSQLAPGNVYVVVVSNQVNQNSVNPLEPRISLALLTEIHTFLSRRISPFVKLVVKNPTYEQIKLDFKVTFNEGYDPGYYLTQLNTDIVQFLSPWAYSEGADITFQGKVQKSQILDFVEEREYVDYLICFKMYHFVNGVENTIDLDEAEVSIPSAIMVSVQQHAIREIEEGETDCFADVTIIEPDPVEESCDPPPPPTPLPPDPDDDTTTTSGGGGVKSYGYSGSYGSYAGGGVGGTLVTPPPKYGYGYAYAYASAGGIGGKLVSYTPKPYSYPYYYYGASGVGGGLVSAAPGGYVYYGGIGGIGGKIISSPPPASGSDDPVVIDGGIIIPDTLPEIEIFTPPTPPDILGGLGGFTEGGGTLI